MAPINSIVNALYKISKYGHMIRMLQTVLPNKFAFLTTTANYNKAQPFFKIYVHHKSQFGGGRVVSASGSETCVTSSMPTSAIIYDAYTSIKKKKISLVAIVCLALILKGLREKCMFLGELVPPPPFPLAPPSSNFSFLLQKIVQFGSHKSKS